MARRFQGGVLGVGFDPLKAPNAPTGVTALAGLSSATVSFTAPTNVGGSAITGYTGRSNPGGIAATGTTSPLTFSGLSSGTSYTFDVFALNSYGPSPSSGASSSVTPVAGYDIAVAHNATPFVTAYPWSSSTGFGTKYTNPATLPTNTSPGVAFSPAGDAIAVAHYTSPYVSAYPWSSSGFGTKYADPATLPTGNALAVAFAARTS